MSRYASRPRAYWIGEGEDVHDLIGTPHVNEHHPVDTGLIDARGDPIMRLPNPCGFGRDQEWGE